ncbi:MAG: deoxyribonuclease IV [Pirellulales bacterium]|nr:deoxyribonuclease IV [Pirellulales bacterium]
MAILGAHMSIAGGLERAVERAAAAGCQCVQIFTKNNNQWKARPIDAHVAARFKQALAERKISHPIAHHAYLINLASPDRRLWQKSINAMVDELRRAEVLGIPHVVIHPGSYTTGSEAEGLRQIVRAIDEIHARTQKLAAGCLLETTAGQGTSLGWRFEHLAAILDGAAEPDRLGVCFDTCHVFAAGYPLGTAAEYRATMSRFDKLVGLERIKAFHLNDSRRELGSRVDRHTHIGQGMMGTEPFRRLLADRRFSTIPMYLETPKEQSGGLDMDRVNLAVLRGLVSRPVKKKERPSPTSSG